MTTKPTICAECKNVIPFTQDYGPSPSYIEGYVQRIPMLVAIPEQYRCRVKEWDLVLGGEREAFCMKKNNGNCPDFEAKEEPS